MKGVGWFLSCQIRTVHLNHMTALTQDDQIVIVLYKKSTKNNVMQIYHRDPSHSQQR